MKIKINGKECNFENVSTLEELVASLKLDKQLIAVELNREIVKREQYTKTPLKDGDALEIVHFVGGG